MAAVPATVKRPRTLAEYAAFAASLEPSPTDAGFTIWVASTAAAARVFGHNVRTVYKAEVALRKL